MLTLILQTQEGHHIEINVQPEDTFADLKLQYSDKEILGLSDSLEQLITNGASVSENTKIFDYVTGSAQEWLTADVAEEPDTSGTTVIEENIRECCAHDCSNTEITTPRKPFFPLVITDNERLSLRLVEIGRLDLCDQLSTQACPKYFLCSTHIGHETLHSDVEQESTLSLSKANSDGSQLNMFENAIFTKTQDITDDKLSDVEFGSKNRMPEEPDSVETFQHAGILCRLCGKVAENPVHLYANAIDNLEEAFNLADKINLCLPVTITITDPLPKQICQDCHRKLDTCHDLALSSLQAEDKLTLLLRENKLCRDDNAELNCPLCVEGDMKIVKKSGLYRKIDLKNDLCCDKNSQTIIPYEDDYEDLSVRTKSHVPTLGISAVRPATFETDLKLPADTSLPSPDGEFMNRLSKPSVPKSERLVTTSNAITNYWELRCKACNRIFSNNESSKDHNCYQNALESQNTEEMFRVISLNTERSTTVFRKKPIVRYNCHFCQRQFTRKESLEKHITILHGDQFNDETASKCYKCKECYEAFPRETDAVHHVRVKHYESSLDKAHANTNQRESLLEELIVSSLYVCEFCEDCFTLPSSLHDHRESEHANNLKYLCTMCSAMFDSQRQLANHKNARSHHRLFDGVTIKRFYVCKYCEKTFLHYSRYSCHVMHHQETTRPYICRLCNVNFESYSAVALHRDIAHPYRLTFHEGSYRSYDCQYCKKKFNREIALVKHIRMHTGERPYKCTICGKGFSQSSGLNTHVRVHSDLRPFTCTKCPRTFKIKGDRDNHVKRHAGNRPYKCEFCTKAFMTQHVYSQHRKIHTDERPYKCEICAQAFRRSHVLTVHMRRHTGEKPHLCDLCPKTYRQRGDLLKHRKIQHGVIGSSKSVNVFEDNTYHDDVYNFLTNTNNKQTTEDPSGGCNSLLPL